MAHRSDTAGAHAADPDAHFGEFTAPIEPFEVHHVLHELYGGVFAAVPTVAGTLFFRERLGQYEYHHFTNSHATLSSQIILGSGEDSFGCKVTALTRACSIASSGAAHPSGDNPKMPPHRLAG